MQYVRIYADEREVSHFAEVAVETVPTNFAPPAPSLNTSPLMPATQVLFLGLSQGWGGEWHPTPRRQFFTVLSGVLEVEVGDGEVRRLVPGDVVLLEDTTGRGHRTTNLAAEETFVFIAQLGD